MRRLKGTALKVASTLGFAVTMAIMKARIDYPLGEIVFFALRRRCWCFLRVCWRVANFLAR